MGLGVPISDRRVTVLAITACSTSTWRGRSESWRPAPLEVHSSGSRREERREEGKLMFKWTDGERKHFTDGNGPDRKLGWRGAKRGTSAVGGAMDAVGCYGSNLACLLSLHTSSLVPVLFYSRHNIHNRPCPPSFSPTNKSGMGKIARGLNCP